ncbi:unnamed protein product (macronuclear) [Paramecium tetraurelia]|uniref:Uncharacterized protein n=1 Tax=Paramecium tetraurelia TaxID=5888 RepID=A0D2W3_PARTE|nr:uncharacterized protein GSPATT00039207001 [Paramecium tetraurelia]CAK77380.1 unnamed protein product [Paramecium tetraurelia]|eukprot:XP_001444777.1 hypothetical protein (macronuclear) [Paramecium tetraurelia strain d4-2]
MMISRSVNFGWIGSNQGSQEYFTSQIENIQSNHIYDLNGLSEIIKLRSKTKSSFLYQWCHLINHKHEFFLTSIQYQLTNTVELTNHLTNDIIQILNLLLMEKTQHQLMDQLFLGPEKQRMIQLFKILFGQTYQKEMSYFGKH